MLGDGRRGDPVFLAVATQGGASARPTGEGAGQEPSVRAPQIPASIPETLRVFANRCLFAVGPWDHFQGL